MNIPIVGHTDLQAERLKRAKQVGLAMQFLGAMYTNVPQVYKTRPPNPDYDKWRNSDNYTQNNYTLEYVGRPMTPTEMFEHVMATIVHLDAYIGVDEVSKLEM